MYFKIMETGDALLGCGFIEGEEGNFGFIHLILRFVSSLYCHMFQVTIIWDSLYFKYKIEVASFEKSTVLKKDLGKYNKGGWRLIDGEGVVWEFVYICLYIWGSLYGFIFYSNYLFNISFRFQNISHKFWKSHLV